MDPKTFEFIFVTTYGIEYRCTMVSVGDFSTAPPAFVQEVGEYVCAGDETYLDLDGFAACHGCVMKDMVSLETN